MNIVFDSDKPSGSSRCCRCGRLLTDPKSIADGIGPKCKAHLQAEVLREQALHQGGLDRFLIQPAPPKPEHEPEWLCMDCDTPTPQSHLIHGRCRNCHTEREIAKIEAQDKERTLPVVAGQWSEV